MHDEFVKILGSERVIQDESILSKETENTLGISRKVAGILYPSSIEEVVAIVKAANIHKTALYPISRGKNMGYGDKVPTVDNAWIVDLEKMNTIRFYDSLRGQVTVEPGVTQGQLSSYLKENKAKHWMDTTGAGLEASILGNTLEGGFGHSPKGNHRKSMADMEVVLGDGTLVRTGHFPGLGPDLSQMFIQSNFGIVVSLTVYLVPIPEKFESFVVTLKSDDDLYRGVDSLRDLIEHRTITSVVHIANALRTVMSTLSYSSVVSKKQLVTDDIAIRALASPFFTVGRWTALGGLFGTIEEVEAKKKVISKKMKSVGKVTYFTDSKLESIGRILTLPLLRHLPFMKGLMKKVESFSDLHNILKGVPTNRPFDKIQWNVEKRENLGLIWYSPTVIATKDEIKTLLSCARGVYTKYGFDMPITLSFVEFSTLVGVLSIVFDKSNPEETKRAHDAYEELDVVLKENNIHPYRAGILYMPKIHYTDGKDHLLKKLKNALDENNVISPGRYGINS